MAPAPSTPMGPQPLARRGLLGHDEPVGTDADGRGRPGHDGWGGSRVTPQPSSAVMPGLEPGIHVFAPWWVGKTWMAGTGPARTTHPRHARPRAGHPRLGSSTAPEDVDGRDRPGHDGWGGVARDASATLRRHARP